MLTLSALGALLAITMSPTGTAIAAKAKQVPGKTVRVKLNVVEKQITILGVPVTSWTYNGTVPGPTIRVHLGDTLEITLENTHNLPHAIHTHFEDYKISSDGSSMTAPLPVVPHQEDDVVATVGGKVPGVAGSAGPPVGVNPIGPYAPRKDSDVARPASTYTYRYKMIDVGTFWYHCHVFEATDHIEKGLFGLIIVYPRGWTYRELPPDPLNGNTKAWVTTDKGRRLFEDLVIISERNPAEDSALSLAAGGGASGGPIHLGNFRAWNDPYIIGPVKRGQEMLLHVANIGESVHVWHLHAHHFYRLWQTWHPDQVKPVWGPGSIDPVPFTPIAEEMHAMSISPGEIFPTLLRAGEPGFWFAHDHVVPQAYLGMVPWLLVTP
ncbi:MAG: multicopper oxidase domain-containing protein [Acidobacteria bacterium]|nr:multicopper oxidase domain-containing protein [Acidobacteriota bacterium]